MRKSGLVSQSVRLWKKFSVVSEQNNANINIPSNMLAKTILIVFSSFRKKENSLNIVNFLHLCSRVFDKVASTLLKIF